MSKRIRIAKIVNNNIISGGHMNWIKMYITVLVISQSFAGAADISGKTVDALQQPVTTTPVVPATTGKSTTGGPDGEPMLITAAGIIAPPEKNRSDNTDIFIRRNQIRFKVPLKDILFEQPDRTKSKDELVQLKSLYPASPHLVSS